MAIRKLCLSQKVDPYFVVRRTLSASLAPLLIANARAFVGPIPREQFLTDHKTAASVLLKVIMLGELAKRVPEDMKAAVDIPGATSLVFGIAPSTNTRRSTWRSWPASSSTASTRSNTPSAAMSPPMTIRNPRPQKPSNPPARCLNIDSDGCCN